MENYLQQINSNFVSLSDYEVRENREILDLVLRYFLEKLKEKDAFFNKFFRRVFYGGSFYDDLKIDKPDEFDLDLLLDFPKMSKPVLTNSNEPGFVQLQLQDVARWERQPEATPQIVNKLKSFLDNGNYLCIDKVLIWMEGIVQKALNDLPLINGSRILSNGYEDFEISFSKGGPAMTLHVHRGPELILDVDLVICFVFPAEMWPENGFRANPVPSFYGNRDQDEFFIVPKKPKRQWKPELYWRLSFQGQERQLINHKYYLKPTVKLLKRLRDNFDHCIASYYIKTVILHLIDKRDDQFWTTSLSHVFMTALKEYKSCIENKNIPYYWYKRNKMNLLKGTDVGTLDNINNCLRNLIKDFETRPETVLVHLGEKKKKKDHIKSPYTIGDTPSDDRWCIIS